MNTKSISLHDFVIHTSVQARGIYQELAKSLSKVLLPMPEIPTNSGVAKFFYDDSVRSLLKIMEENTPCQHLTSNFDAIVMPFDKIWVESVPNVDRASGFFRTGFLLCKRGEDILARYVMESHSGFRKFPAETVTPYIKDGRFIMVDPFTIVLSKNGIGIEETDYSRRIFPSGDCGRKNQKKDMISLNLELYGPEILRFLHVFSHKEIQLSNAANALVQPLPHKNGMPTGTGKRKSDLNPIQIDLTPKTIRQLTVWKNKERNVLLLGVTKVMRHMRTYHTRSGPVRREVKPHDRRIASEVDRRNVARKLTCRAASAPVVAVRPQQNYPDSGLHDEFSI